MWQESQQQDGICIAENKEIQINARAVENQTKIEPTSSNATAQVLTQLSIQVWQNYDIGYQKPLVPI